MPPKVDREIAPTVRRPAWIGVRPLTAPIDQRVALAGLDPGETDALGRALEIGGHRVLVDDRPARRLAASIGLSVIGTVGLLVVAKRQGVNPAIRPNLDALRATNFFVSGEVIEQALRNAGE